MSLYAIGDIHGQHKMLLTLLDKMELKSEDEIVFLGDYIDRGKHSKEVIDTLIRLSEMFTCVFLKGNHEQLLLDYTASQKYMDRMHWESVGGNKTIKSYRGNIPKRHMEFFNALRLYYETDDYIFVHAGVRKGIPMDQQLDNDLLWIRDDFFTEPTLMNKTVVFGHTPIDYIKRRQGDFSDKIPMDFGAGYGERLGAIKLPEQAIITVDAI